MTPSSRRSLLWLSTVCVIAAGCKDSPKGPRIELVDPSGRETRSIDAVEAGNSMSIRLAGLTPRAPVEVFLNDDQGREWSYARLLADSAGVIGPTVFWYQSGVIGKTSRKINFTPDPAFVTFEEAEAYFAQHPLTLRVQDRDRRVLARQEVKVKPRRTPLLYPSNAQGILYNSVDVRKEDLYVTGRNFPAGSTVHLFVVDNQYHWELGDPLVDRTGPAGEAAFETVKLGPEESRFTVKVWDHAHARPGAFDLVARVGAQPGKLVLERDDILAFNDETAVLFYDIIDGNIVIETAGRMKGAPAKFEFSDAFEKLQDVYGAVDPTDVPAVHSGGNYAAYWVLADQPASYWDGATPALTDVSPGGPEIHRVKYWCINMSRRLIWPAATQADPVKGYDVVVDFGSTPAMNAADFTADNTYNKGTDFVDGYDRPGFSVLEDPGSVGPYPVGQVELNEPNGISGITDPAGVTGPTQNVTLAWARIMYPAVTAGTGTAVNTTKPKYPVALFLHGRHVNCDNDGSGPGLSGVMSSTCAVANRIPSHEGYNYIMERLASQGIFSISISAHEIQPGLGIWDYNTRGRLVLKFLDKLRSWSTAGTDPFGGIFNGKLDLTKVALSGHSRGGEGVVAAQVLNATWPSPHSIVAVNTIAPTDQNGTHYLMTNGAYFLLIGARDGDLWNMQGFRTYDRAYPEGAAVRRPKMISWAYRANHNYFNTIWTDAAALGSPNPWAGAMDDSGGLPEMSAADQRSVGLTTIAAFFRWQLQGIDPYKEIFTGRVDPPSIPNDLVYWTYQDADRKAADDFEQSPLDPATNRMGGSVTAPGFTTFAEQLFNNGSSVYPSGLPTDAAFYHDTRGLKLAWTSPQTYTTNIPVGQRDASMYTHMTLRVAKKVTGPQGTGPAVNLLINVEDGTGKKALWDLRTDQFDLVPHPFEGSGVANQALMNGVRIPLRNFTQNNSGVDLTNIAKITIRTEGSGEIGIDDIEFGK